MAVAETVPSLTKQSAGGTAAPLWSASLLGGVLVLAGLAAVLYGVPLLWSSLGLKAKLGAFPSAALLLAVQVGVVIALAIFGVKLGGGEARKGVHGGIFVAISLFFTIFFVARAPAMWAWKGGLSQGACLGIFLGALVGFGLLGLRFLRGKRFTDWALGIEHAGFFSTFQHKKALGLKVRRMTILGILLVVGTGVYTLMQNDWLEGASGADVPEHLKGSWLIRTPFLGDFALLPDIHFTVPLLLIAAGLWFAWRAVNIPEFGDFLIATEAEINKVSWPTKRQLFRDTVVTLVFLALFTAFLFIVDVFWGWFLSRNWVGVLPGSQPVVQKELEQLQP